MKIKDVLKIENRNLLIEIYKLKKENEAIIIWYKKELASLKILNMKLAKTNHAILQKVNALRSFLIRSYLNKNIKIKLIYPDGVMLLTYSEMKFTGSVNGDSFLEDVNLEQIVI